MEHTEDLLFRQKYEDFLNESGCPHHDHPDNHGRVPYNDVHVYGTWLRLNDPITFTCGYHDWRYENRI